MDERYPDAGALADALAGLSIANTWHPRRGMTARIAAVQRTPTGVKMIEDDALLQPTVVTDALQTEAVAPGEVGG